MYIDTFDTLFSHFNIYAIDIPGFGVSKAPPSCVNVNVLKGISQYVEVLYEWCRNYGLDQVYVAMMLYIILLNYISDACTPCRLYRWLQSKSGRYYGYYLDNQTFLGSVFREIVGHK
jgi:hypothetical protein